MADTSGVTSSTAVQSSLNLWSVFPSWKQLEETVLGPLPRGPSAKPYSLFYDRLLCSGELLLIPSFLTFPTHQFIKVQRPLPGKGAKMHGPELPSADLGVGPGICMCTVASALHTHVRAHCFCCFWDQPTNPPCAWLPASALCPPLKSIQAPCSTCTSTLPVPQDRLCSAFGWLTAPRLDLTKANPHSPGTNLPPHRW